MSESLETTEREAVKPPDFAVLDRLRATQSRLKVIQDARFAVENPEVLHTPAMYRDIIARMLRLVE